MSLEQPLAARRQREAWHVRVPQGARLRPELLGADVGRPCDFCLSAAIKSGLETSLALSLSLRGVGLSFCADCYGALHIVGADDRSDVGALLEHGGPVGSFRGATRKSEEG